MKTSELTGAALNWAVGVAQGMQWKSDPDIGLYTRSPSGSRYVLKVLDYATMEDWSLRPYTPASSWAHAGPIIEREEISISREFASSRVEWAAWTPAPIRDDAEAFGYGPTPLIAAMRCYVASVLGDTIDIPAELI
jgi:hypothetical protein